ncbi:putative high-affinity glucose transporter [Colletotrichum asianum]
MADVRGRGPSGNGYAEHDDNPTKAKATIDIDWREGDLLFGALHAVRGIPGIARRVLVRLRPGRHGHHQRPPAIPCCHPGSRERVQQGIHDGYAPASAFIGCWFYPYISDRWSRKKALLLSSIIFCIGGVIRTAAYNYATVVVGRTIGGIGTGTLALGAPMYISEVSRLISVERSSFSSPSPSSEASPSRTGSRMLARTSPARPRGACHLHQLPSAMILGAMIQLFPYSPRWLAMQDRHEDCLSSLCKLRKLPASDERVQAEYQGILAEAKFQAVMLERRHAGVRGFKLEVVQWLDLFTVKSWRRTIVGAGVSTFQQFQGVNGFIYYAPTLFRNIGQSDDMSLILSGIFNALQIVGVFIAFILIDRVGRRPLAIYGGIGNMICFVVIAALVGTFDSRWGENTSAGWACVAMAFLFIIIFGASYSSLGWALPPEVFPNGMRSKGVAFSVAVNWLSNFTVGVVTPPMIESIGFGTYVFFACFCGLAAVWAFFLTMGKTLEQMDEAFGDHSGHEEQEVMREILGGQAVTSKRAAV